MQGPIETGWQIVAERLPADMPATATNALRFMYFAGAARYRMMTRLLFLDMDGEERVRMLAQLTAEIDAWERSEPMTIA